jgi:hypothetical protein
MGISRDCALLRLSASPFSFEDSEPLDGKMALARDKKSSLIENSASTCLPITYCGRDPWSFAIFGTLDTALRGTSRQHPYEGSTERLEKDLVPRIFGNHDR